MSITASRTTPFQISRQTKRWLKSSLACAVLALAGCGGGGGGGAGSGTPSGNGGGGVTTGTNSVAVTGTVAGLSSGTSVQLTLNGKHKVTASNGGFTFPESLPTGQNYAVTVLAQPEGQVCGVGNATGTAGTSAIAVVVSCQAASSAALADLGITSIALSTADSKYFSGKPGSGTISVQYDTATAAQIEITAINGLIGSIVKNSGGNFEYQVTTTNIAAGVYPYTLQIRNSANAKTVLIAGTIEIVEILASKTEALPAGGNTSVTLEGSTLEITTPSGLAPVDMEVHLANSTSGKVYSFEFSRNVSQDDIRIKLPAGAAAYDPYGLTTPEPTGALERAQAFVRVAKNAMVRVVEALAKTGAPSLNTTPYSSESDSVADMSLLGAKGLGQLFLKGEDAQFVNGVQGGRIWNPTAYRPESESKAGEILQNIRHVSTVTYRPAYQVHTSIVGNAEGFNWNGYEPVLFVHGYSPDVFVGGGQGTWESFPSLVQKTPMPVTNNTLVPFEIHWSTNQSFRLAAVDLATTIDAIHKLSKKKVHIVAHSFGGVLTRTMLQNIAKTGTSTAAGKVASVMTLGTPHSGILPDTFDERNTLLLKHKTPLPPGQDAKTFSACNAVTCFEMGIPMSWSDKAKANLGLTEGYADPGMHAAKLRNTVGSLPALKMVVGIGLSVKDKTVGTGDYLISFGGQRFISSTGSAGQADPNAPLLNEEKFGDATVSESILGLPVVARPGQVLASNPLPARRERGYVHSGTTGLANLGSSDGGALRNFGIMAAPKLDCDAPSTCTHAGYALFRELLNDKLNWSNIVLLQDTSRPAYPIQLKNTADLSNDAVLGLQANLELARSSGIIHGARIEWSALSREQQVQALGRLAPVPDSKRSELLKKSYVNEFADLDQWVSDHINASLWSSTRKSLFTDRDSLKTWLSLVSSMGTALRGELRIAYAPAAAGFSSGVQLARGTEASMKAYQILQALEKYGPWIDFVKSCPAAAPAWRDNANKKKNAEELDLTTLAELIAAPMDCVIDELGLLNNGNPANKLTMKALSGTITVASDPAPVTVAQAITSLVQAVLEAAPSGSVYMEYVRGVVDIAMALLDSYQAGQAFADRSDVYFLVDEANFRAAHEKMRTALMAQRAQQILYAKSADYYEPVWAEVKTNPANNADVGDTVRAWVTQAIDGVASVVWKFGSGIKDVVTAVINGTSEAASVVFDSSGIKNVVAIFRDTADSELGRVSTTLSVGMGGVVQTVSITQVQDDTGSSPLTIANGGTTEDTTPVLRGTISAALSGFYSVRVYSNGADEPLGTAAVSGTSWSYTPATALPSGMHQFTARVVRFDGAPGSASAAYSVRVQTISVAAATPAEVVRANATNIHIAGTDLPTTGLSVLVPGHARNTCAAPQNLQSTGFDVSCTFYQLGTQPIEVWYGSRKLGALSVTVKSNVTAVAWSTGGGAYGNGTVQFGQMVTYKVTGTQLLADSTMGFAVERCGVSNTEVGTATNTERTFQCWFNNEAGATAGSMSGVVATGPGGERLHSFVVPVEVAPIDTNASVTVSWDFGSVGSAATGKGTNPRTVAINDGVEIEGFAASPMVDVDISTSKVRLYNFRSYTGAPGTATLTSSTFNGVVLRLPSAANWVFGSASVGSGNTMVGLTSARLSVPGGANSQLAINLQGLSFDASTVLEVAYTRSSPRTPSTSKLPHSGIKASQCYQAGSNTLVACDSAGAIALSGAGKQDGMLASVNPMAYSTVGSYSKEECVKDNVTGLVWEGKTASGLRAGTNSYTNYHSGYYGTQAQMDAATNTYGYVAYVNSIALCGYTDWRLPTMDELQSIVDYGVAYPGPTISTAWFPNTANYVYWSSSPYVGYSDDAWVVSFASGYVVSYDRFSGLHVRLVRASQ